MGAVLALPLQPPRERTRPHQPKKVVMLENRALEIIIIAVVVLVLFGAKRLPDTARSLGKSLRILKAETRAGREEAAQQSSEIGRAHV